MSQSPPPPSDPTLMESPFGAGPGPSDASGRGVVGTLLAWICIIGLTGLLVASRAGGPSGGGEAGADAAIPSDDAVATALLTIQGRYVIGAHDLARGDGSGDALFRQVDQAVPGGPPRVRLRKAILAAELAGPDRGLEILEELEEAVDRLAAEREGGFALAAADRDLLEGLRGHFNAMAAADGPVIAPEPLRETLARELGWWGRLGGVLGGPPEAREPVLAAATRAMFVVIGGVIAVAAGGLVGLVLLVLGTVGLATGRLRVAPEPEPGVTRRHGRLAEVFAVWIALFVGLQLIGGILAAAIAPDSAAAALVAALVGFFASLLSLAWAPWRGLAGPELAGLAGLHRGRGWAWETACGVVGYLATLPLLGIGLLLTLLLAAAAGLIGDPGQVPADPAEALMPATGPAHPIIGELGRSGRITLLVLLTGAVAAPIVEEIAFRGCLYGHLRHGLARLGRAGAITLATLVNAFIFAVIHPQGFVAVPALMSLAIGFSLVRQWRGSVVAPVVMHAINNGLVLGVVSLLLA
ncbi:MAG: lysostaphin resistance A-like protein [Planctomycetota bacterium]